MEAPKQSAVPDASQGLKNGLKSRHLTMISIAGVIGGALFIGSGNVIYWQARLQFWPMRLVDYSFC